MHMPESGDPRELLYAAARRVLEQAPVVRMVAHNDVQAITMMKSLGHPIRVQLLGLFALKPMTAKLVADALGQEPAKASYHVKQMFSAGILRLDHTNVTQNGIVEKYYAMTAEARQFLGLHEVSQAS